MSWCSLSLIYTGYCSYAFTHTYIHFSIYKPSHKSLSSVFLILLQIPSVYCWRLKENKQTVLWVHNSSSAHFYCHHKICDVFIILLFDNHLNNPSFPIYPYWCSFMSCKETFITQTYFSVTLPVNLSVPTCWCVNRNLDEYLLTEILF